MLGKQTCTGPAIAPGGTCTVNVRFAPRKLGGRLATLVVANDAGPDLSVGLGGNGVAPADASNLRSATSCESVRLTWRPPDAAGFSQHGAGAKLPSATRATRTTASASSTGPAWSTTRRPASSTRTATRCSRSTAPTTTPTATRRPACASRCTWVGSASHATAESIRDLTPKVDWTKLHRCQELRLHPAARQQHPAGALPTQELLPVPTLMDVPSRPALARARRDVPLLPVRVHAHAPQRRDHRPHHLDRALTR